MTHEPGVPRGTPHQADAGAEDLPDTLDGDAREPRSDALRDTRTESFGAAIGSFMAGLEEQIFQRRPPAVELVRQAQPVRMVSGEGMEITISVPDAIPPAGDPER
jgi:hypothetical protein